MQNLYLGDAGRSTAPAQVVESLARGDGTWLRLTQNLYRPAGGGQPADRGQVEVGGRRHEISDLATHEGRRFLVLPTLREPLQPGVAVTCTVDAARRLRLSQCHSLLHVVMGVLRWTTPGYVSQGGDIDEDETTCRLWFKAASPPNLGRIEADARTCIAEARPVNILKAPSLEAAAQSHPHFRADPALGLSGRIRLIEIGGGHDCNPCSGTHVKSTDEIGPFAIDAAGHAPRLGGYEIVVRRLDQAP